MRRKILFLYIAIIGIIFLWLYTQTNEVLPNKIFEYYQNNYLKDTGAENQVAAIYLFYRVFDTLFEALMLLVSVIGIIYFSRHEGE